MRRVIRKWFWAWDFDKEEKWLNEMSAKGLSLVAVGFCKYTFEECNPGAYNVRLEILENGPSHAESQQYIKFLEETGVEYLGSIMRWVYFRKKTDDGEFNIYSDTDSRIKQLNRILALLGIICLIYIPNGLNNISLYFQSKQLFSLVVGILCLGLSLLIGGGFLKIYTKKKQLKKEANLFE